MKKSMKITTTNVNARFACPLLVVLLLLLCSVPAMAQNHLEAALAAYKAGDYDTAIREASEAIRFRPDIYNGYLMRGLAYCYKKDYKKAIPDLTEAIRLSDNLNKKAFGELYWQRASSYLAIEDFDKAIADYETAVRYYPELEEYSNFSVGLALAKSDSKRKSSAPTYNQPTKGTSTTFTDSRDGKQYKKVTIGRQTWMAENLNYAASGSKCYDNKESNCQKYGRLYNWNTAKSVCPSGWHLPSKAEWEVLTATVGGEETEGKYLKTTRGWDSSNGVDAFGFSALPGGSGYPGDHSDDQYIGTHGNWWISSENNTNHAYYRMIIFDIASWASNYKTALFSVRCVQD